MSSHHDENGFRVEFEAEVRYHDAGSSAPITAQVPGYLEANSAGITQYFDTASKRFGYLKPSYTRSALFEASVQDVSSLKWNEATGAVHLNTRKTRGMRSLRPMYYSDREVAIDTADRLAALWFPGATRIRTEMSARQQRFDGMADIGFMAVFSLVPVALIAALAITGQPLFVWVLFGAVAALFALLARSGMKHSVEEKRGTAELIAAGKGWIEVANPAFQA